MTYYCRCNCGKEIPPERVYHAQAMGETPKWFSDSHRRRANRRRAKALRAA